MREGGKSNGVHTFRTRNIHPYNDDLFPPSRNIWPLDPAEGSGRPVGTLWHEALRSEVIGSLGATVFSRQEQEGREMAAVLYIDVISCPGPRAQKESLGLLWQVMEGEASSGKSNVVLLVPGRVTGGSNRCKGCTPG